MTMLPKRIKLLHRFFSAQRWRLWYVIALASAATCSAFLTFFALDVFPPFKDNVLLNSLVWIDALLLFLLMVSIFSWLFEIWLKRKRGFIGYRLHLALVLFFCAVTIIPTMVLALFSSTFITLEIESWFSMHIDSTIDSMQHLAFILSDSTAHVASKTLQDYVPILQKAVTEYHVLEDNRHEIEYIYSAVFILIALLLMMVSVAMGFWLAERLVGPVRRLILASKRLGRGNLSTRISIEGLSGEWHILGEYFNDMANQLEQKTAQLIEANRMSIWSDAARRVAHEIKNPLTPIQLANERLSTKFLAKVENEEDRLQIKKYLDMINRQVEDIQRLVDEFATYARLPKLEIKQHNITTICEEVVDIFSNAHTDINFSKAFSSSRILANIDASQIREVLNNLIKNSIEAIEEKNSEGGQAGIKGNISMKLSVDKKNIHIIVADDGVGFYKTDVETLTEPYNTTKEQGSGLGLAIVRKIIEDHGGSIVFNNQVNGATVEVILPSHV